jgi:hypothetical protein
MLYIQDTGTGRASLIWSVAALVARTGGSFSDLQEELRSVLGGDPETDETLEACAIAHDEVTLSGNDDATVGAWMMLCRLAGRLQHGGLIDLSD